MNAVNDKDYEFKCKRGFLSIDMINQNMGTNVGGSCNGCEYFAYESGLGFCKLCNPNLGGDVLL